MDRLTVIDWAPARATAIPPAQSSVVVVVPTPTAAAITNPRAHAAGPSAHTSTTPRPASATRRRPAATPVITGISGASYRTFDRDNACPPPTALSRQYNTENSGRNIKRKKARMQSVSTPGFTELQSTHKRTTVWYFRKNIENVKSYRAFLHSIESELIVKLRECVISHPIKYNLKLEATYAVPNVENTNENRAFKSSARELYSYSDVEGVVDRDFTALLAEEDSYAGKNSGFALSCIDGMLLGVYEYSPMGGSSYLPLPPSIADRKAVINPQNIDLECFKWAILAKHVPHVNRTKVGANYFCEEHRYDFSTLSVPTPVSEIKLFKRANPGTSINVYGVRKCINNKNKKSTTESAAYPLRVVDDELPDHFDLLLITGSGEKSHYTYVSNFSRLASMQKNSREHRLFFCKKCFTSFDDLPLRYKLHGEEALARHRLVCGTHKPILPILPPEGSTLEFTALCKTQRVPFVMYADFEALLVKSAQRYGDNTEALHTHQPMSYGFMVVAADGVPAQLMELTSRSTSRGLRSFFAAQRPWTMWPSDSS
ncbi:uncharacterized protein LOC132945570 [Metopolophium dirhodum]|uniref:uncharacterized protein LOC132945570 n=1 Tax=Metopolophium dirhodum TaxID=44670 RepID=UPI00298FBACC|nr:uncharacterized protein LOC132945570 [Metopolophium dirhodum]